MRIKSVLNAVIGITSIFGANLVMATPPPFKNVTVTRDGWLKELKRAAPEIVCHGFTHDDDVNQKLIKAKIDYEQCLSLIPAVFDGCQAKYYSLIPGVLKNDIIAQWGSMLGKCVGEDFGNQYLDKK